MGLFEWTEKDRIQAEAFRLGRLRRCFPELLNPCWIHLNQLNILNIHASTPEAIDDLTDNLEELAWHTWLCTGATEMMVWFCQEEIVVVPTQPASDLEWKLLDSIQSAEDSLDSLKDFSEMTAATLSPAKNAKGLIPANLIEKTRPQLKRLATVADLMQLPITEAESVCDREGIPLQIDEDGNPVIRLDDAAELLKNAALMKLSAPRSTVEVNGKGGAGGTTTADQPAIAQTAEPEVEAAEPTSAKSRQQKVAELPEDFRVVLSDPKKTAANALVAFVPSERNQKRRRQIATAIANQTTDGLKYLRGLLALYPKERQEKAAGQLRNQFKKLAENLSKDVATATAS